MQKFWEGFEKQATVATEAGRIFGLVSHKLKPAVEKIKPAVQKMKAVKQRVGQVASRTGESFMDSARKSYNAAENAAKSLAEK